MSSILLVDDADFLRMMFKDILVRHGYKIAGEAPNGRVAIEAYKTLKPDMVLMNIIMPEMDGIEALKKIKEFDPDARVVMCSAMGQPGMVIEALMGGAIDFVAKPFQPEWILSALVNAFVPTRILDMDALKRMYENFRNHRNILSQREIDEIINCALAGKEYELGEVHLADAVHSVRVHVEERDSSPQQIIENEILNALNKLVKGQEEMNAMLAKMINGNDK